jgi:hypothetical protein
VAENLTVFSLEEKNRIRYHLGYLVTSAVVNIQLGFPAASQTLFLLEAAMDRVPVSAAFVVRNLLAICETTENRLLEAQKRMAAEVLDEITLRADECQALENEHTRWASRLADLFGVPLNPYSYRYAGGNVSGNPGLLTANVAVIR